MASAEYDFNQVLAQMLVSNGGDEGTSFPGARETGVPSGVDRVVQTAKDRPKEDSLPALSDPAADHEDANLSLRRADVEAKHQRVIEFLEANGYDGVLLGRADSLAWFTSGGDLAVDLGTEAGAASLFISKRCRSLITDNVQSARLFEEELAGLGFQLKERAWTDDPAILLATLVHGKKLATDLPQPGLIDATKPLRALRYPLTGLERQRLRELGRTLTLAVEATCRNFQPGETEADIAGHLSHRLLREGVTPVGLRIAGDDRLARYRQPTFKAAEIKSRATIAAVGRRHGLCAAVTRTVSFGKVDASSRTEHTLAAMVDATCIYFSRPGEAVAEVFRRAKRIYEKYDCPHEWTLDYQGAQIGYAPREMVFRPDCPATLAHGMAVCWSPSVGSARSEDTVVVDSRGFEVVTEAQNWPKIEVMVKGFALPRPAILER